MQHEASIKFGQYSTGAWWYQVSAGASSNRSGRHGTKEDAFLAALSALARLLSYQGVIAEECAQSIEGFLDPPREQPPHSEEPRGQPLEPSHCRPLHREPTTEVGIQTEAVIRGLGWAAR